MAKPNIIKCIHGSGSLVLDLRYYPLFIFQWYGSAEPRLFDYLWDMRDEFALRGDPPWSHVYIHDLSPMSPMTSTARKYVADKQANDPQLANLRTVTIPIVPNPLLRGVMTAIVWMTGKEKFATEFSGSLGEAIPKAMKIFETWGVQAPRLDPASYVFPAKEEIIFRQS